MQGEFFYRLEGVDDGDELPADLVVADFPGALPDEPSPSLEPAREGIPLQVRHFRVIQKWLGVDGWIGELIDGGIF